MYAPVIVFAYNRPKHLNTVLRALSKNNGAENHEVFVFVDGPKDESGRQKQSEVISAAKAYESGYFKSYSVEVSQRNKGLANSVIGGVSRIMEKYGRAIIVEDDSVSAEGFLEFMNSALEFYRDDPTVWSVGGYTVPVALPGDYSLDVIKTQRVSSYAWATWRDRWDKIDWELKDYKKFCRSIPENIGFDRWGNDRSAMLYDQMNGVVDSWAIRFDYAMYVNDMYNIVPRSSLIKSIGHDGSGTHSTFSDEDNPFKVELDGAPKKIVLSGADTDERIRKEFCKPFALPLSYRVKIFIKSNFYSNKQRG